MSEQEQAAEAVKEAPAQNEIEDVAKELGWNPDYDGEDAKTAREFIINSKEIQKTQRDHAKKLKEQLEATRGEVDELRNGFSEFENHLRTTHAADVARWKSEIAELKAEHKSAMRDGDVDAAERLERKIESTEKMQPKEPPKTAFPGAKDVAKWVTETEWYNEKASGYNADAKSFADAIYAENFVYGPDGQPARMKLPVPKLLKKIEREVKKEFPELFEEEQKKPTAPSVEGAGHRVAPKTTKIKSIKDLPDGARQAADRFVNKMKIMTEAEYIKDYLAQEGA